MKSFRSAFLLFLTVAAILPLTFGCGKNGSQNSQSGLKSVGWCGVSSNADPSAPGLEVPRLTWSVPITVRRGNAVPDREWAMIKAAIKTWDTAAGITLFSPVEDPEAHDGEKFPSLNASLGDKVNSNYFETAWTSRTGKISDVLATTVYQNASTGPEADIRYNIENYVYGDSNVDVSIGERTIVDLESVALHELGHLLSLAHVDEAIDSASVMKLSIEIGPQKIKRTVTAGDVGRIKALHNP